MRNGVFTMRYGVFTLSEARENGAAGSPAVVPSDALSLNAGFPGTLAHFHVVHPLLLAGGRDPGPLGAGG